MQVVLCKEYSIVVSPARRGTEKKFPFFQQKKKDKKDALYGYIIKDQGTYGQANNTIRILLIQMYKIENLY